MCRLCRNVEIVETVSATPATLQNRLDAAQPGQRIELEAGVYPGPYRISGLRKQGDRIVELTAAPDARVIFSMSVTAEAYRTTANRLAKQLEDADEFPGLWRWFHEARLSIRDCEGLVLKNLHFEQSWPTFIHIRDSQQILITGCTFLDGCFAIGADGRKTGELHITDCSWRQCREPGEMWRTIAWHRIHGTKDDGDEAHPVDVDGDWRMFDGDFFRSVNIAGRVEIDHCDIRQAFNAIHAYNDPESPRLSRDFHVHDNLFVEIRDNVLEGETAIWNWSFHHNRIFNCHKWFSFEVVWHKHLTIFANVGSYDSQQGDSLPADDPNWHGGGGVFKLTKDPVDVEAPFGPAFVFHNSFRLRADYLRKGVFSGLRDLNNAIAFTDEATGVPPSKPKQADLLGKKFTKAWEKFDMRMNHSVMSHVDWPENIRAQGWDIGLEAKGGDPQFAAPGPDFEGFATASPLCDGPGAPLRIEGPDDVWRPATPGRIGAVQSAPGAPLRLFEGPPFVVSQRLPKLGPPLREAAV